MDALTGDLTAAQALQLARELAWVRPLAPYPGWYFDRDWHNPGLAFQLRRTIWTFFQRTAADEPFVMDWYDGLRVQTCWSSDESKQLYVGGCIEPNEFAFLAGYLRAGMVFFDIGANNGLFTLFAARRVAPWGGVWAFEPSSREFGRLQANLALNALDNVWAFRMALANFAGSADLKVAESEHAGHNTLGEFVYQTRLLRSERVPVKPLDRIVADAGLDRLDAIKIDAEGSEHAILEGGRAVLEQLQPLLLLEVLPAALEAQGSSALALFALLESLGYQLWSFDSGTGRPIPADVNCTGNVIALPARRQALVEEPRACGTGESSRDGRRGRRSLVQLPG